MTVRFRVIKFVDNKWTVEIEYETETREEMNELLLNNWRLLYLFDKALPDTEMVERYYVKTEDGKEEEKESKEETS